MSPELRIDPLSGLRVIVAGERGSRPGAFLDVPPRAPIDPEGDPFAAGHEDRTPPEVHRLPDSDGGWRVRVVPNLYPALEPGEDPPGSDPLAGGRGEPDLFASRPATGAHEVVVNAPDTVTSLAELAPEQVASSELAGEPILDKLTAAPGNGASIGGLKVVAEHGWFAARPSGTEDVYKIYAESFQGDDHLERIVEEAQAVVDEAIGA